MLGLGNTLSQAGSPEALELATNAKSIDFDGSNDYIDLDGFFRIGDYTEGTVALWFKAEDADVGGSDQHIFSARDQSGTDSKLYIALTDDGKIKITLGDGSSDAEIDDISYSADTWTHIAVTWKDNDGSGGTAIAYLNGTAHGTTITSIDSANGNGGKELSLGGYAITGTNSSYDGKIDEVGLWNAELTATEIKAIYDNLSLDFTKNSVGYVSSSSLQAWCRMGDSTLDEYPLVADQTNATLGTALVPNLSDNGDYDSADDSNWYISTGNIADWTVNTNTSTAFGVTKNGTDTGDLKIYFKSDNSALSSNLTDDKVYKLTYTLATTGTLPSDKKRFYDGASYTNLAVGTNIIYFRVQNVTNMYIQFRTAVNAENFTLSNINIEPVNGNPGLMINMASGDIETDVPS